MYYQFKLVQHNLICLELSIFALYVLNLLNDGYANVKRSDPMDFYLTAPDGSRIHFPVNPDRITCDTGNRILTFDVIALGEISLPRGRVPTRFSFEGFFPGEARKDDPMVKSWRSPKELAGLLSLWRNEGIKLRLLVTETPINHDVYFDGDGSFQHEWLGGHGDCWYNLRFVEARELIIRPKEKQRRPLRLLLSRPDRHLRPQKRTQSNPVIPFGG